MRSVLLLSSLTVLLGTSVALAQNIDPGVANELTLTRVVMGLSEPTAAEFLPDGKLVIIERGGGIKVWTGSGDPINAGTVPVDSSFGERGLLGLAIDPAYSTSNRIYFYYSAAGSPANDRNRVAWATLDPNTNMVDVAGRTDILTGIYGPANHDGGGVIFGPDGYLYIGAGDMGCNCDCPPGDNRQNYFPTCLTNLNGKIMRIDRDGAVPPTNPLVNVAAVPACGVNANCQAQGTRQVPDTANMAPPRTEIYAWGFRNPWRFSFDSATGYLWIGDVGEVTYEEITISKGPGEHHGWPFREGVHGQERGTCSMYTPAGDCVEPAFELPHDEQPAPGGGSITGGVFSHHCSWPEAYRGRYWFADYVKNRVWTLTPNAARDGVEANSRVSVVRFATGPAHFFNGPDGAVYFAAVEGGAIYRITPTTPAQCPPGDDAGMGFPDAVTPPPPDSGTGGQPDASDVPVVDAGNPGGGGGGGGNERDSGCGCDVPQRHRTPIAVSIAAFAVLGLLMYSRRRRK
jgi:glucose/arabinose dehydrogenase